MKIIPFLFGAVMCLTVLGCGPSGPEMGKVKGKVTLGGKPLPDVQVTFEPDGGGPVGTGVTNQDGEYQLFSAGRQGAQVGTHRVVIASVRKVGFSPESVAASQSSDDPAYMAQALGGEEQYKKAEQFKDPIPPAYGSGSQVKKDVQSGNNEINFEL